MRVFVSVLVVIASLSAGSLQAAGCPFGHGKKDKNDQKDAKCPLGFTKEMFSKSHKSEEVKLPLLHTDLTVFYTPVSQQAGGTWELMVLGPDGKLYKDKKHKRIDILNPPTHQLHFKIKGPLPAGVYTIAVYVKARSDAAPVDVTELAEDVSIVPSNGRVLVTQPDGFFTGNSASTSKGETAEVYYTLFDPKHQG